MTLVGFKPGMTLKPSGHHSGMRAFTTMLQLPPIKRGVTLDFVLH